MTDFNVSAFHHLVRIGDEAHHRGDETSAERAYLMAVEIIGGNECFELVKDRFLVVLQRNQPRLIQ